MKTGYIKTHRSIQDCWIWNCEKYDKAHAWLDLLLDANHKDVKMLIDSKPIVVGRGCLYTSKLHLAEKWGWDRKTVTSFLSILEGDGMIKQEAFRHGTMITVINYRRYQQSEDITTDTSLDISLDTTTDTSLDTNKNDKNVKNEKNDKEKENIKEKETDPWGVLLAEWLAYKKQRKESYKSQLSVDKFMTHLKNLSGGNIETAKAIIDQSIAMNYQGIFPLKTPQEHQAQPPQQQPGCIWSTAEQRWIPI